jgi:type VI secretion system protein ImpK
VQAEPESSMSEVAAALPLRSDEQRARALLASARPLIALATQLRRAVLDAPDAMKRALAAAVDRFERELAAAGWDERSVSAASYLLCVWVDEVVADTPWGAGGAGLLERFHGEHDGSAKVLRLLSRLAERPAENRALLELFHACLSLGLKGNLRSSPDAARQLEQLRARVFLALPHAEVTLAPPWHSAVPPGPSAWRRRLVLGVLLLLGLAALGVYTTTHLLLAQRVDEVFASMQQWSRSGSAGPGGAPDMPAPADPRAVARLAPLLADDLAARRLVVRDEAHRSVVTLPADALFEPGSTQLASNGTALLTRVGAALKHQTGKVLVIGHTDGADARTARLPSAWHQSYEWARQAADALGTVLPPERLAVEGAADFEEPGNAATLRRRIDIVLYP